MNISGELKWTKVTINYLNKYKEFISLYFKFIQQNKFKVRIMFRQKAQEPQNISQTNKDNKYFLLYYQFIKHAFGFKYFKNNNPIFMRTYFDELPDKPEKAELFKNHIYALQSIEPFISNNIKLKREDIIDVDSKKHIILQGLDIILGSIAFRLNDLHKIIPEGQRVRGKRTRAKEDLYKHINSEIRKIYPHFNIGITTGIKGNYFNRWNHVYRHWKFISSDFRINDERFKK